MYKVMYGRWCALLAGWRLVILAALVVLFLHVQNKKKKITNHRHHHYSTPLGQPCGREYVCSDILYQVCCCFSCCYTPRFRRSSNLFARVFLSHCWRSIINTNTEINLGYLQKTKSSCVMNERTATAARDFVLFVSLFTVTKPISNNTLPLPRFKNVPVHLLSEFMWCTYPHTRSLP